MPDCVAVKGRCSDWHINKSLLATLVAVVLGITLGLTLRLANLDNSTIDWIRIWGELFIRMFKAVTLPIIVSCVIVGTLDVRLLYVDKTIAV